MPQGKLRSGVYRSFIMCDDPRGVVDSGAIKKQSKSRSSSTTNQRCDHPSKSEMAPRISTGDAPPSSLHLLRVSKEIQKINVAIESWSKGLRCDHPVRPEDIAKDLLRGALDLEESLAMLSSIQEEDIKQKPRISQDGRRDLRFRRSMSDRFGERIEKRMISQEKVASRDCYEELRKAIRESFQRQNLLPQTTSTRPGTRVFTSDFASSSGLASSSSSSHSSMVSSSTKSSASSGIPRRAPNLIARLMGMDVSSQELPKSAVNHIDKLDVLKSSSDKLEQPKKNKESPELLRCSSTRQVFLQSSPEEIPSENPSTIVLIRPTRVIQSRREEKPGNKLPVSPTKPRMQGEVHPRMINERKNHQTMGDNKMRLPLSVTKKGRESKDMVQKVEQSEGKVIKLMSPSNAKTVKKDRKLVETNKKLSAKMEVGEGKDRYKPHGPALKPPNETPKKPNTSSDMLRNKVRRSRLSSSSSSGEQKSTGREKKVGEASRPKAKKKLHQQDNDLASESNSGSTQDTRGSLNQLSAEETTSSEFNIQGHCDNEEVSSRAATAELETSQISLKSFLSSSPDFLNYAETLFDFEINSKRSQASVLQNRDSTVISDQKLALNFAKEVARRRSLLIAEPTCPQRSCVDIDVLVMEVYDGFESLKSYRDTFLGQTNFVKESIHMLLEKDLKSKRTEMTSGVWDLGWRSEFQIAETYQAVVDLEKLILSGLILELFLS